MVADFLLWELFNEDETRVFVLVPLLSSSSIDIQKFASNSPGVIDHRDSPFDCDYSHYNSYLSEHRNDPPNDLIRYMYQYNPTKAIQVMTLVYASEDIPHAANS